jgi:hypothetical protein
MVVQDENGYSATGNKRLPSVSIANFSLYEQEMTRLSMKYATAQQYHHKFSLACSFLGYKCGWPPGSLAAKS